VTSLNSATVGSGGVVNETQWTYNNFEQSIQTYQSHAGAVNSSTTPSVQVEYADGSTNTIRPTALIYPNGRAVAYDYGVSAGINDAVSRIASQIDGDLLSTHLADYHYLGLSGVVKQNSSEATLEYTLVSLTGGDDPVTGDIYAGLDSFGRIRDLRWRNTAGNTDLSRVQYGYNRASSRTWRANPSDPGQHFDWLYGYDGLQRVTGGQRGTLNGTQTAITDPQFGQCWTLDNTGNWQGFRQDGSGSGTWSLQQSRVINPANEITSIVNSVGAAWADPVYDSNGNVTTMPQPVDPTAEFTATYDAWNRMVKLVDTASGDTVQENQYDGRNYRTVVQSYTSGALSETRNVYYTDGWQEVEGRLGTAPESADPDRQFSWGIQYIDSLICRERSVNGILDERFYGCQDSNWNMTAIVDISGDTAERFEYTPYGSTTFLSSAFLVRSGSAYSWDITYGGYKCDTNSGLYAVRNRSFNPTVGCWLTRDSLSHQNLYLYVGAMPLHYVDPLGLEAEAAGFGKSGATNIIELEQGGGWLGTLWYQNYGVGGGIADDFEFKGLKNWSDFKWDGLNLWFKYPAEVPAPPEFNGASDKMLDMIRKALDDFLNQQKKPCGPPTLPPGLFPDEYDNQFPPYKTPDSDFYIPPGQIDVPNGPYFDQYNDIG
jgi:RHS repeat-associated protein